MRTRMHILVAAAAPHHMYTVERVCILVLAVAAAAAAVADAASCEWAG